MLIEIKGKDVPDDNKQALFLRKWIEAEIMLT
jgi:hypothetical protein